MADEKTIDDLVAELDKQATPDEKFEPYREKVNEATKKFVAGYSGKRIKGRQREDAFNEASKQYLQALGFAVANDENDRFYGSMMQSWLTDEDRAKASEAIKNGDSTQLADIFKGAYIQHTESLKTQETLNKIQLSPADEQEMAYKKIARLVANDDKNPDYLQVVRNPAQAVRTLAEIKARSNAYRKDAA
jgi:hypothetical protein